MGCVESWQCGWPLGLPPRLFPTVLVLFALLLAHSSPTQATECEPSQRCCQLQKCWDLFQASTDALGVPDDLFPGRQYQPTPEELRRKCITLRTFHSCINMTRNRGCLGDLSFHSAHKGVESRMKQSNCSLTGPVYVPGPSDVHRPRQNRLCSYQGRRVHRQCGLFGDPHLRTFNEEFHTCRVQGAWPLLNNDYLTVQVTNDPVGLHTATATSKLTVVVKANHRCGDDHFVTYQAQTDNLPATFDDGRTHLGRDRSVQIREMSPGRHVEIYVRYIDTTLIVRQIGRYFTFAAKMPEDVINQTRDPYALQLCVRGCPLSERIDYKDFLAQKRTQYRDSLEQYPALDIAMSRDAAEEECRRANVSDFYFDSCVFDLLTTGDANFTVAASKALQDLLRLNPHAARMHNNRTSLVELDREYAGSAHCLNHGVHRTVSLLLALWTFFLCS